MLIAVKPGCWLADCGKPWTEGGMSEGRLDSVRRDAYALLQRKYGSGVVKPMKTEKNSPFSDKCSASTTFAGKTNCR